MWGFLPSLSGHNEPAEEVRILRFVVYTENEDTGLTGRIVQDMHEDSKPAGNVASEGNRENT